MLGFCPWAATLIHLNWDRPMLGILTPELPPTNIKLYFRDRPMLGFPFTPGIPPVILGSTHARCFFHPWDTTHQETDSICLVSLIFEIVLLVFITFLSFGIIGQWCNVIIEAAHRKQNVTLMWYVGTYMTQWTSLGTKKHVHMIHDEGVWKVRTFRHVANESLRSITNEQMTT